MSPSAILIELVGGPRCGEEMYLQEWQFDVRFPTVPVLTPPAGYAPPKSHHVYRNSGHEGDRNIFVYVGIE